MSNKTNKKSSRYTVALEKVLKSKSFDALCRAVEAGIAECYRAGTILAA